MSEANIPVSKARTPSAGARIFRGLQGPDILLIKVCKILSITAGIGMYGMNTLDICPNFCRFFYGSPN